MKYSSTRSWDRPTASKICAIVYEPTVLMPILLITLSTPLPSALTMLRTAWAGSTPVSVAVADEVLDRSRRPGTG